MKKYIFLISMIIVSITTICGVTAYQDNKEKRRTEIQTVLVDAEKQLNSFKSK
ncbi:hypothetical protein ACG94X_14135 [Acinetobacter sp. ULE_I010]|uniref:hypothetical protein n=1 Tax=Acinetobacter sp. ULE_I010 TaxID=3373065 RepID=UPI003AF9A1B9